LRSWSTQSLLALLGSPRFAIAGNYLKELFFDSQYKGKIRQLGIAG